MPPFCTWKLPFLLYFHSLLLHLCTASCFNSNTIILFFGDHHCWLCAACQIIRIECAKQMHKQKHILVASMKSCSISTAFYLFAFDMNSNRCTLRLRLFISCNFWFVCFVGACERVAFACVSNQMKLYHI